MFKSTTASLLMILSLLLLSLALSSSPAATSSLSSLFPSSLNVNAQDDEGFVVEDVDDTSAQQQHQRVDIDDSDDSGQDGKQLSNKAVVLVHQYLVTDVPAEGESLTFRYIITNAGGVDAQNIKFTLPDFPSATSTELDGNEIGELYTVVEGTPSVSIDALQPGQKHSVDFTIIPTKPFSFTSKMTAGKVEYRYGPADPPTEKIGLVSTMGSFEIMDARKYAKTNVNDPLKWIPFAFAVIGSIAWPLGLWFQLYNKAEKVISFSSKKNQ